MLVVDASVAVKWFIPESGSEEAGELLQNREKLMAPELIRVEVPGAFTRLYRMDILDEEDTKALCQEWTAMIDEGAIVLSPLNSDYERAVALSLDLKHPLADCFYIASAERLALPLVTADSQMAKKAESCGVEVRLIEG